jgi:hypothetical protein
MVSTVILAAARAHWFHQFGLNAGAVKTLVSIWHLPSAIWSQAV